MLLERYVEPEENETVIVIDGESIVFIASSPIISGDTVIGESIHYECRPTGEVRTINKPEDINAFNRADDEVSVLGDIKYDINELQKSMDHLQRLLDN